MNWQKVFYNQFSGYAEILNTYLQNNYTESKLGDYIKILGGYAFKSSEYRNEGIPIIRISDFQNEEIVLSNVKYYNEDKSLSRYELHPNDIIIAMTGGTIGKLAIVQKDLGKLYLNQRVGKFQVIDDTVFDKEFIYWIARGVEEKVKNLAWGGAQPNVSSKQIENMPFYCPDKETQKNIVRFFNDLKLNQLDNSFYFNQECETKILNLHKAGIDANNLEDEISNQQNLLTKLKQSILQEAIEGKLTAKWREENQDIEPASVLLDKIQAEKEQLIKEKKIKKSKPLAEISEEEIPFDIPDSWVWSRIIEIGTLKSGNTYPNYKESGSGIPYVKVGDMNLEENNFSIKTSSTYFDVENIKEIDLIPINSIIFPKRGGAIATNKKKRVLDKSILVDSNTMAIILPRNIDFEYFYSWFKTIDLSKLGNDSVIPQVNNKDIEPLIMPIPSYKEQKEIVNKIEKLFVICDELEEQINSSKQNTQTLMQAVLKEAFEK